MVSNTIVNINETIQHCNNDYVRKHWGVTEGIKNLLDTIQISNYQNEPIPFAEWELCQ